MFQFSGLIFLPIHGGCQNRPPQRPKRKRADVYTYILCLQLYIIHPLIAKEKLPKDDAPFRVEEMFIQVVHRFRGLHPTQLKNTRICNPSSTLQPRICTATPRRRYSMKYLQRLMYTENTSIPCYVHVCTYIYTYIYKEQAAFFFDPLHSRVVDENSAKSSTEEQ